MHHGRLVVSGHAWAEYCLKVQNASFSDFWLYCCQYFANNAHGLERDFEQRYHFALTVLEDGSSHCYSTGFRVPEARDFSFSYAYEVFDPSRLNCNCIVELFLNFSLHYE